MLSFYLHSVHKCEKKTAFSLFLCWWTSSSSNLLSQRSKWRINLLKELLVDLSVPSSEVHLVSITFVAQRDVSIPANAQFSWCLSFLLWTSGNVFVIFSFSCFFISNSLPSHLLLWTGRPDDQSCFCRTMLTRTNHQKCNSALKINVYQRFAALLFPFFLVTGNCKSFKKNNICSQKLNSNHSVHVVQIQ